MEYGKRRADIVMSLATKWIVFNPTVEQSMENATKTIKVEEKKQYQEFTSDQIVEGAIDFADILYGHSCRSFLKMLFKRILNKDKELNQEIKKMFVVEDL